jgi:hypothetical protein
MGQKPHTKEQDEVMQRSQGIGGPRLRILRVISYHNNWSLQHLSEPFVKSKHFVNKARHGSLNSTARCWPCGNKDKSIDDHVSFSTHGTRQNNTMLEQVGVRKKCG